MLHANNAAIKSFLAVEHFLPRAVLKQDVNSVRTAMYHSAFFSKTSSRRAGRSLIKLSATRSFDAKGRRFSRDISQPAFWMDVFCPSGSQAFAAGKSLFPSGGCRSPTHVSPKHSSSAPAASPRGREAADQSSARLLAPVHKASF